MNKLKLVLTDGTRIVFGILIIIMSLVATVVSTLLSISYFSKLCSGDADAETFITGFIILLQSMVFIGSVAKGFVFEYSPQHYNFINRFTNIAFVLSVLSTISFFNSFDKSEREKVIETILGVAPSIQGDLKDYFIMVLTNITLIWIGCILIDLMAMKFPGVGIDLIFKIRTVRKIEMNNNSYLKKLVYIIGYFPKYGIDYLYNKLTKNELTNQVDLVNVDLANKKSTNEKLTEVVDLEKEKSTLVEVNQPNNNKSTKKVNLEKEKSKEVNQEKLTNNELTSNNLKVVNLPKKKQVKSTKAKGIDVALLYEPVKNYIMNTHIEGSILNRQQLFENFKELNKNNFPKLNKLLQQEKITLVKGTKTIVLKGLTKNKAVN